MLTDRKKCVAKLFLRIYRFSWSGWYPVRNSRARRRYSADKQQLRTASTNPDRPPTIPAGVYTGIVAGPRAAGAKELRLRCNGLIAVLYSGWGWDPTNFRELVLGCIEAKFCK